MFLVKNPHSFGTLTTFYMSKSVVWKRRRRETHISLMPYRKKRYHNLHQIVSCVSPLPNQTLTKHITYAAITIGYHNRPSKKATTTGYHNKLSEQATIIGYHNMLHQWVITTDDHNRLSQKAITIGDHNRLSQ